MVNYLKIIIYNTYYKWGRVLWNLTKKYWKKK